MKDNKNNTGKLNSGNRNSGDWNSGDLNSGNRNSGNRNSGNRNSGYRNSGKLNSGDLNSGNRNSGDWNSGDLNSGNWNSGNWNSGKLNSGDLNTNEPKFRIFNKETDVSKDDIVYPHFFYFDLNSWIREYDMSDKEKEAYPSHVTTGGYLKTRDYKQAWREAWDKVGEEDRKKCFELPNWDNELFKEISGIDVEKEIGGEEKVTIKISKKSLKNH